MEATYRTKAIVLDRSPYQECDSQVAVYSWLSGRQNLIAKGTAKINSKLAGHLEPFNLVELMVIRGRGADYAGAADSLAVAGALKGDWHKIQAGGYLLALYKKLLKPGESDRRVFLLLAQFIYWLNAIKASPVYYQAIARLAAWKLLNLLGLADVAMLNPRCPHRIKKLLTDFGRADLVDNLKNLKLTSAEAGRLSVYLDRLIIHITE
jgi:DNA repair protein RecO